jgi:hypothetical protein
MDDTRRGCMLHGSCVGPAIHAQGYWQTRDVMPFYLHCWLEAEHYGDVAESIPWKGSVELVKLTFREFTQPRTNRPRHPFRARALSDTAHQLF